jgi:type II secretory pathway pseudopilin PulG
MNIVLTTDKPRLTRMATPSCIRVHPCSSVAKFRTAAFTMMEIAISLAVIGIALVAIIGVLPYGMNVQQDNRQQTIIDQDSSVFLEAIRNGQLGLDDLTNYVYAITNSWTEFLPASSGGGIDHFGVNGYTYSQATVDPKYLTEAGIPIANLETAITNGANIIGLMSTPEFTDVNGNPVAGVDYNINNYVYSNHVVAYCYSVSGPAYEKPPQDNSLVRQDSFGYRIYCVNAPMPPNTNELMAGTVTPYEQEIEYGLHELRLSFEWPQLANGNLGPARQTFRTLVAGQLQRQPLFNPANNNVLWNTNFYFYQSQWFTNAL